MDSNYKYFSGRVFFDHLPKTAGTAVTQWLLDNLGDGTVTPPSKLSGPHLDLISKFGGLYPVISGHTQFLLGDDLDPRWNYITILRDPIDRCLSWMFYLLKDVNNDEASNSQINGAKLFFESNGSESTPEFIDGVKNFYVRHFSSINCVTSLSDESSTQLALHNIGRYKIVGFQDDLKPFMQQLTKLIGIEYDNTLGFINKTSVKTNAKYLSPKLIEAFLQLNNLDIIFYKELKSIRVGDSSVLLNKTPDLSTVPKPRLKIKNSSEII